MSAPAPIAEQPNDGAILMVPGQFMQLDDNLWQFVKWSEDGLQEFYSRKLKRHQPYHPSELRAAWEAKRLLVLPPAARPAKASVLRNIQVPFDHYSMEQQRIMKIREHYVKALRRIAFHTAVVKERGLRSLEHQCRPNDRSSY